MALNILKALGLTILFLSIVALIIFLAKTFITNGFIFCCVVASIGAFLVIYECVKWENL